MGEIMMTSNTHFATAKFRQEGVHDWQSEEGSTDATNLAAALDAQTEATLALAYEQRTANLIALYSAADLANAIERAQWDQALSQITERLDLS